MFGLGRLGPNMQAVAAQAATAIRKAFSRVLLEDSSDFLLLEDGDRLLYDE